MVELPDNWEVKFPEVRTVHAYEGQASTIVAAPQSDVHGLVQSREYVRTLPHYNITPEGDFALKGMRAEHYFSPEEGERGKLKLIVAENVLDRALHVPGQRDLMRQRRDEGVLQVYTTDEAAKNPPTTLYMDSDGQSMAAYLEEPVLQNAGVHGTVNTPEGRRIVERAEARLAKISLSATDVTDSI